MTDIMQIIIARKDLIMNKVILTGRLTSDPTTTKVNDTTVTKFSIAVRRGFKNKDGEYEADFINVSAWGKQGETIAKYFKKGDPIEASGSWRIDKYEKDGVKVYYNYMHLDSFGFPLKNKSDNTASNPYTYGEPPQQSGSPFTTNF